MVVVVKQIGAIGFVVVTALLDSTVTKTRVQNINGDVISDSVTGSYRCFSDTLNRTTLRIIKTSWLLAIHNIYLFNGSII
jgi:hypothetical protein